MKTFPDSPKTGEKLRVGIIGIYHESNTFISDSTTLQHYQSSILLVGEEVRAHYGNAHHEISGFLEALSAEDVEAVPIIFACASPWGPVTDEALDAIWNLVCAGLDQAGPLDGILAAPHGAGVNESRRDMDGWWLGALRERLGPSIPIISTVDLHANLSPAMVAACDAMIAYRENPHLDQRERGVEAARMIVRTLRREIRPVSAGAFPPIVINIERQFTQSEPILSVLRELEKVRRIPGILSVSVMLGFPYADVFEMGSAFVVVADDDLGLARRQADQLAAWLVENREQFRGNLISPGAALERVEASARPVGLLDMGDNMGGGAPADSTMLARLAENASRFRTFICLADADSAQIAREAGIGARLRLKMGGKLPMSPAPPLDAEITVLSIHDGKYTETQPCHGGKTGGDMGPTVIVKSDSGMTIMLTTRRSGPFSLQPLLCCGVRPEDFDVIIIKGVHAPVGAYAEACPVMIRVNTPGVTTADLESLVYHQRRKPLFPFEEI